MCRNPGLEPAIDSILRKNLALGLGGFPHRRQYELAVQDWKLGLLPVQCMSIPGSYLESVP